MTSAEMVTDFAVYLYEPSPEGQGLQRVKGTAKVADLFRAINEHLKGVGLEPDEYLFTSAVGYLGRAEANERTIPNPHRWLVAFAVEGGSEGYYVHVGAMISTHTDKERNYIEFGICKTNTADSAYNIAREVQRFLTAAAWN